MRLILSFVLLTVTFILKANAQTIEIHTSDSSYLAPLKDRLIAGSPDNKRRVRDGVLK